jgi:hypothetical protein
MIWPISTRGSDNTRPLFWRLGMARSRRRRVICRLRVGSRPASAARVSWTSSAISSLSLTSPSRSLSGLTVSRWSSLVRSDLPVGAKYIRTHRLEDPRLDKLSERLARSILSDIVVGEMQVGAMLPSEAVMMESYGVGRNSVREALRILEIHGLVKIKPGPRGGRRESA